MKHLNTTRKKHFLCMGESTLIRSCYMVVIQLILINMLHMQTSVTQLEQNITNLMSLIASIWTLLKSFLLNVLKNRTAYPQKL